MTYQEHLKDSYNEGMAEGVKKTSLSFARALLGKDFSDEEILELTKIPSKELQKLKKELSKQG